MNYNLPKPLKISIYILVLINILSFLIAFNFSNLEGIHYKENIISLETGIKSEFWAYSFVISLMIFLGNIYYDLKSLSNNRHFQDSIKITTIVIAIFITYGMMFTIPFHEIIILNNPNKCIIIKHQFVIRGLSSHEIKYEDINCIKYVLQHYYVRNPAAQNYISLVNLTLNNGRNIQVSSSSQDINSVSLREKLAQEIARATGKKIEIVRKRAY